MKQSRNSLSKKIRTAHIFDRKLLAKYGEPVSAFVKMVEHAQEDYKKDALTALRDGWKTAGVVRLFWISLLTLDDAFFSDMAHAIRLYKRQGEESDDPDRLKLSDTRFWLSSKIYSVDEIHKQTGIEKAKLRKLLKELGTPHKKSNGGRPKKPVTNKRITGASKV